MSASGQDLWIFFEVQGMDLHVLYVEPQNGLIICVAMYERESFKSRSLKPTFTCVFIDFSFKVIAWTHFVEGFYTQPQHWLKVVLECSGYAHYVPLMLACAFQTYHSAQVSNSLGPKLDI